MDGTQRAYDLLEEGKAAEALEILVELDRVYPNTREVITNLVNAYYDLKDMFNYEHAARRLIRLEPPEPDLAYGLADKNREAARTWIAMWKRVDPHDPDLKIFEQRVGSPGKA